MDWVVVGSGFGGSVSALRLAEKGYSVAVLECGSRFRDEDFASLDPARTAPLLLVAEAGDARGPADDLLQGRLRRLRQRRRRRQPRLRQHPLPGPPGLLRGPAVGRPRQLGAELAPHYDTAERMLGVVEYEGMGPADVLLRGIRRGDRRRRDLHATPRSASSSTSPGSRSPTPSSKARARRAPAACAAAAAWSAAATAPRTRWSRTTSGSPRSSASQIEPERQVTEIRPLGAADGSDGYAIAQRALGLLAAQRDAGR